MSDNVSISEMQLYHLVSNVSPPFHRPLRYENYILDNTPHDAGSMGYIKKFDCLGFPSIVIKKFTSPLRDRERAQLVLRELNLLRTVQHENIIHLIGTYTVDGGIYHVTDYCGERLSNIIDQGEYPLVYTKKWTSELLRAVQHMHSNEVIHRNLHPGNICIDAKGKLTVIGFGHARVMDHRLDMTARTRGTPPYMPIELLVEWNGAYNEKVDIWSTTVILCEMITGRRLFRKSDAVEGNSIQLQIQACGRIEEEVLKKVKSDTERRHLHEASKDLLRKDFIKILREKMKPGRAIGLVDLDKEQDALREFIDNTLQFDPAFRMSAYEALHHRFLLTPPPPEDRLPDDDVAAIQELERRILSEINASQLRKPCD